MAAVRHQDPESQPKVSEFEWIDGEACRRRLLEVMQPVKLVRLAEECEARFPDEVHLEEVRRIGAGARTAVDAQRQAGMSAELFEELFRDAQAYDMVSKAIRGDMDAAYGLAQMYKTGKAGIVQNPRRMEQWLLFSSELGSGRASWELADHYSYVGLVSDAARFEKRALDLGFRPPLRLPSRGY